MTKYEILASVSEEPVREIINPNGLKRIIFLKWTFWNKGKLHQPCWHITMAGRNDNFLGVNFTFLFYSSPNPYTWKERWRELFISQICIAIVWFCTGRISFTQWSLEFYDRKMKMMLALRRMTKFWGSRSRAWAHAWDAGIQSSNSILLKACWVPMGKSLNLPSPLFPHPKVRLLMLSSFVGGK